MKVATNKHIAKCYLKYWMESNVCMSEVCRADVYIIFNILFRIHPQISHWSDEWLQEITMSTRVLFLLLLYALGCFHYLKFIIKTLLCYLIAIESSYPIIEFYQMTFSEIVKRCQINSDRFIYKSNWIHLSSINFGSTKKMDWATE